MNAILTRDVLNIRAMAYLNVDDNGSMFYFKDKKMKTLHKEDGPAMICKDGTRAWYLNGVLHREDGPAVEHAGGSKSWYLNGKLHRAGGPAVEGSTKTDIGWFVHGVRYSYEEYKQWYFRYVRTNTLRRSAEEL